MRSRRRLLQFAAAGLAATVLAACRDAGPDADQPEEPEVSPTPAASPSPAVAQPAAPPLAQPSVRPPLPLPVGTPPPNVGPQAAVAPAAPAQLGPAQVHVLVPFETRDRPGQAGVLRDFAEEFVAREPNLEVRYTRLVPTTETRQQLAGLFGSGSRPDVMLPVTTESMHAFIHEGAWLDTMPFARRDGFDLAAMAPAVQDVARATSYWGDESDRLIGVPLGVSQTVVAIRADALAAVGLEASDLEAGWSLTQVTEAAMAAARPPGHWGIAGWDVNALVRGFGGHEMDAARTAMALTSAEVVAAVQTWRNDIFERRLTPNVLDRAAAGGVAALWAAGSLGVRVDRLDAVAGFGDRADFDWVLAPAPRGPAGPATVLDVNLALVVGRTGNPEAAWRWVRHVADGGRAAAQVSAAFGLMPARADARDAYLNRLAQVTGRGVIGLAPGTLTDGVRGDEWTPRQPEVRGAVIRPAYRRIESGADVQVELGTAQAAAQVMVDAWLAAGNRAPVQR